MREGGMATSPADLEQAFLQIAATRMRDMPLCNPALSVEAYGFRTWLNDSIGILITPWCMNLICLPAPDSPWQAASCGSAHSLPMPSGDYEFLGAEEESIGAYLSSSLFSPMFEFVDMAQAKAVAEAVLAEVFSVAEAPATGVQAAGLAAKLEQPLSRRGFFGTLLRGGG